MIREQAQGSGPTSPLKYSGADKSINASDHSHKPHDN